LNSYPVADTGGHGRQGAETPAVQEFDLPVCRREQYVNPGRLGVQVAGDARCSSMGGTRRVT